MSATIEKEAPQQFDTIAVHGGHAGDPTTKSRAVPLYQTTSFLFDNAEHAERLFGLQEFGNIYTRIMNPTTDVFEQRIAALEGGVAALATASGQAAVVYSVLNVAKAGDHVVSSCSLYGGTYNAFQHTFKRFGIDVSLVDFNDLDAIRKAIRPNTKAVFAETVGNPKIDVLDIEAVAAIAHENGLPLIVDNTLATPYLQRPIEFGADIVVHSATKYIGGHGTAIGGVIVDGGKFDWGNNPRFAADFVEPDPSYHGLQYAPAFGNIAYILKARVQLLRDVGAALSPFNAWLLIQGLETLGLRVERHVSNAHAVAEYLTTVPQVESVSYAGLPGHPAYELTKKYLKDAPAVLTFQIKGGAAAAKAFINRLKLFSLLANFGDAKSLVIHPFSTTHQQLDAAGLEANGIDESTVRLSVGIEDKRDIIADLAQAFA